MFYLILCLIGWLLCGVFIDNLQGQKKSYVLTIGGSFLLSLMVGLGGFFAISEMFPNFQKKEKLIGGKPVNIPISAEPVKIAPPKVIVPVVVSTAIQSNVADILFSESSTVLSDDGTVQRNLSPARVGNHIHFTEETILHTPGGDQVSKELAVYEIRNDGIYLISRGDQKFDPIKQFPVEITKEHNGNALAFEDRKLTLEQSKIHHEIDIGPCITDSSKKYDVEQLDIYCKKLGKIYEKIGSSANVSRQSAREVAARVSGGSSISTVDRSPSSVNEQPQVVSQSESSSIKWFIVSREPKDCVPAESAGGKDMSPISIARQYGCRIAREEKELGILILDCTGTALKTNLMYFTKQDLCRKSLRAQGK